jgi:O-antigen/teichoic acid export membrane protein
VRSWPDRQRAFWATFNKVVTLLAICSVLVVAEFLLFAEPAIRLLYGVDFAGAALATRLVTASECVAFFTALAVTTLVAQNRNVLYPLAALAGVVVNVGLNLVVIPRWSYRGAAVDTLVTELLVAAVLWIAVLRTPDRSPLPARPLLATAAAGMVATGVGYAVHQVAPWVVAGFAVAGVFGLLVHALRIPGPEGLRSFLRDDETEEAS